MGFVNDSVGDKKEGSFFEVVEVWGRSGFLVVRLHSFGGRL